MKAVIFALSLCFIAGSAAPALAQGLPAAGASALPSLPDEAVIAVFDDGTRFTMAELKTLIQVLPEQNRQMALINRGAFVQWWAGMRKLAALAEKDKLDQQSPAREQIALNRTLILGQAMLTQQLDATVIDQADVTKFYEANKERYKQVKVKALYIAFGGAGTDGKKPLSEDEAKAKATKLLAQIRSGADFAKLVKENSDDATSREKDGDFATLHPKDNIPDAIRAAVFSLKNGEVTEPVRQPGGYYLLRAEDVGYAPLQEVHNEIYTELRQQQFEKWLRQTNGGAKVEFPNPAFPGTPTFPQTK